MSEPDDHDDAAADAMSFEDVRRSFYYGDHADMQFKYLARMADEDAVDAIAEVLQAVGEVMDTGDIDRLRQVVTDTQIRGYEPDEPPTPTVDDTPFTPLSTSLADARLALISAGGVFVQGDDPMGPDGPTQTESLVMIQEFLRGRATLSEIPSDTPMEALTARHPGYDARTAQRDPQTVFPLAHLRDIAREGRIHLADTHYAFTGATSQRRLEKETAPAWAEHMAAREVDAVYLVAT